LCSNEPSGEPRREHEHEGAPSASIEVRQNACTFEKETRNAFETAGSAGKGEKMVAENFPQYFADNAVLRSCSVLMLGSARWTTGMALQNGEPARDRITSSDTESADAMDFTQAGYTFGGFMAFSLQVLALCRS
jgi:hypothetical protein